MRSERRNTTRLAQLALIGLCVALVGCSRPQPPAPKQHTAEILKEKRAIGSIGTVPEKSKSPSDAKESPVNTGSGQTIGPVASKIASQPPPRPGSPAVISVRVASEVPFPSETEAESDAIVRACETVSQKLSQLNPPIYYQPSPSEVREKYLRQETRTTRPPTEEFSKILAERGDTRTFVSVEYVVEVTADQIREIRSRDRVLLALRVLGGLAALALAGFLFLRADEWTKGYLTSWLALAAVTLAGGAAAALIFI